MQLQHEEPGSAPDVAAINDPRDQRRRGDSPDAANWLAFGVAVSIAIGTALYRATLADPDRASVIVAASLFAMLVVWIPGYFWHAWRKRSHRRFLRFASRAAIILTGLALLGDINRGGLTPSPARRLHDFRIGKISAFQLVRSQWRQNRSASQGEMIREAQQAHEAAWKAIDPRVRLSDFRLLSVDDSDGVLRTELGYSGSADGAQAQFVSRVVNLFHEEGIVTLDWTCVTAVADCSEAAAMLRETEMNLRKGLQSASLVGLLPGGGDCEVEEATQPHTGAILVALGCEYPSGVAMSIARRTAAEAAEQMHILLDGQGVARGK